MFRIISDKRLKQTKRDERHRGITLGYQLAQSERTNKGFIYGCQGITFEKQNNQLFQEIDDILKAKNF